MLRIAHSLFESENICLAPIDHEKDAEIESQWTHDASYMRLIGLDAARPLSPAQVKKRYEKIEKQVDEDKNRFYFTIRMRGDDRLIGFAELYWVGWSNGTGHIRLGIGSPQDRLHGYGTQVVQLLLRFAFDELNLYRLTATIPEYNVVALHVAKKAGFTPEVRRRQAVQRGGRRWDLIHMGILRDEWKGVSYDG
jgi:RimJ/RimL family protein N-acetyltransferase